MARVRGGLLPLLAVGLVVGLQPVVAGMEAGPPAPVNGVHQAYHPGAFVDGEVVPSQPADYDGEPLTVVALPVGREAFEPTLGVDADGVAFFAAANFDGILGLPRTQVMRSTDGGRSWEIVGPQLPAGNQPDPPATLDPYVYVDTDTGRVFTLDLTLACSYLSFSDDQGESWTTNPLACGQVINDHQTIVTGPPPPALQTVGYPNVLYYCFNRVTDSSCSRSLDGGLTFTPTGTPSFPGYEVGDPYNKFGVPGLCGGLHGHARSDDEGRLFIPKSHCGLPVLAISEDGGTTWRRTVVSTDFRTGSGHVGEHHAVDIDDAGNVYYLFWDDDQRLPWLAVSTDRGHSFSEPMMVAPPGVNEVNFPVLVAGEPGRIAFHFPGSTATDRTDNRRPWNSYMVASVNVLDDEPLFVSTTANIPDIDPIHRGNCNGRCAGMFDFLDIVVSPVDGGFWASVTDTCTDRNNCRAAENPGAATDAQGIAVRQVGGPRIRTEIEELSG